MPLSDLIAELRLQARLTQRQLARQVGVSRTAVANWEAGTRLPDPGNLARLSSSLKANPEQQERLARLYAQSSGLLLPQGGALVLERLSGDQPAALSDVLAHLRALLKQEPAMLRERFPTLYRLLCAWAEAGFPGLREETSADKPSEPASLETELPPTEKALWSTLMTSVRVAPLPDFLADLSADEVKRG